MPARLDRSGTLLLFFPKACVITTFTLVVSMDTFHIHTGFICVHLSEAVDKQPKHAAPTAVMAASLRSATHNKFFFCKMSEKRFILCAT